jgi:hypothetical protein
MRKVKKTPVIFRVMTGTGKVVALYPEIGVGDSVAMNTLVRKPAIENDVISYRHAIERSRPATPNESQDLLKEIRARGTSVIVRQKWNGKRKAVKS